MARPPMPLGTHGTIRLYGQIDGKYRPKAAIPAGVKPTHWRAITNYRAFNGHTRPVERSGKSASAATRRLREFLADVSGKKTTLNAASRFSDAAKIYLDWVKSNRSGTTYDRYTLRLNNHVLPALGGLLIRECRTKVFENYLNELQENGVPAWTRRGYRTVMSGVMGIAVKQDIIELNPVREVSDIEGQSRRPATAFEVEQLVDFLTKLDADRRSKRSELPEYVRFLFGTGARFGEALAVRWRDLNLADAPVVRVSDDKREKLPPRSVWLNGTIVWVDGKGLVRNPTKSKKSNRVIGLPDFLHTLLLVRRPVEARDDDPVFPSGALTWRAPSNMQRAVRGMRERIGHPEFVTHVGRKTVATVLDEAGQSARQIADQLGHANPSFTQDVYMGRGWANPAAAKALDALYGPSA